MSKKQLRGQPPTAFQLTERDGGNGMQNCFSRTVVLCVLVLGIALLGACGQGEEEGPAPQPGPTSTITPLPAVVTFTPMPTETIPPLPDPTETALATPTPEVTATDPAPTAISAPTSDAKVTVLGEMNIRSGPSTEYEVIGDAVAGEEFAITGKNADGNWWRIDFRGETGWIYAPFVVAAEAEDVPVVGAALTETPVPEEETAEATVPTEIPIVTVGGDMNVRSGPGEAYDRIGGAFAGEAFAITGKNADGDWWQIDFGGQTGWVFGQLVTATNAETVQVALVIPAPPPPTATPIPPTPVPVPTQPPAPRFPYSLIDRGQCPQNREQTFFEGLVYDRNNNPKNGVCLHIAFGGPRNTKCTGCGKPTGNWGFSPFGGPARSGTFVEIYVVNCPNSGWDDPRTRTKDFSNLSPLSEAWTTTIGESVGCVNITFKEN